MANYNDQNPRDTGGPSESQNIVTGLVIDDKDPTQTGRFRIRMTEQDEGKVPDTDLPWYSTVTNGSAQNHGIGQFPPANYQPGSKIMMMNLGAQGYVILGAITNNQKGQGKEDAHPETMSGTAPIVNDSQGNKMNLWDGMHPFEVPRNTKTAQRIANQQVNGGLTHDGEKKKTEAIVDEAKSSPSFQKKARMMYQNGDPGNTIADKSWDKQPNSQKTVKKKQNGELIKQAVDMMESLKKTAKQGSNPRMPNSVGGMGNIISGLLSIASFYKKVNGNKPKPKCDCTLDEKFLSEECKIICEEERRMAELLLLNQNPANNLPVDDTPSVILPVPEPYTIPEIPTSGDLDVDGGTF